MQKVFNSAEVAPLHSAVYMVDRGDKLGYPLRWYDADTQTWSRCEYNYTDLMAARFCPSALPVLPWCGPVKAPESFSVALTNDGSTAEAGPDAPVIDKAALKAAAKAEKLAAKAAADAVKAAAKTVTATTKPAASKAPAWSIWFRADRNKFVATNGSGVQECARPTLEGCVNFLKKKYDVTGTILETAPV